MSPERRGMGNPRPFRSGPGVSSEQVKRHHVLAISAAFALSAFAGVAVAAQPCGKAVIDDWYDNGTFDRAWDCQCLRDAVDRLPAHSAPFSSVRDDFQREMGLRLCEGSSQQTLTVTLATPTAAVDREQSSDRWLLILGVILAMSVTVGLASAVWRKKRDA